MFKNSIVLLFISLTIVACGNKDYLPKPQAQLSLKYPVAHYKQVNIPCPFNFEISDLATVKINKKCWVTITYPLLNASIDMTYMPVKNNINKLLKDAEKLTYSHAIKADGINSQPYLNKGKHIYATLYHVTGNAASPLQFHATDSIKHFLTGALYFNTIPNYDSVYPAAKYIEKDVKHLIETLNWK